jgi:cell division septation protein DedD
MIRPNYWGVVMLSKPLTTAVLVVLMSAGAAQAQSLSRLGGPANLPPSGFDGQQFVDARGCLFMRAGFGANVTWVPRVDRSRNPICGYPPTFDAATLAAVETAMAPDPEAQAPLVSQDAPAPVVTAASPEPLRLTTVPKPPKGYRLAWTDDRLNPMRGIGTAEGQAQQDRVWTRDVPARLVDATPAKAEKPVGQVTVSTMSAPEGSLRALVQVGSFADPANARRSQDRLVALGLPVATGHVTAKGKALTVVYAGPFDTAGAAQAALAAARGAGFDDAMLRMN